MSTKTKTRCMVAVLAIAIASLLVVGSANAQTPPGPDPSDCSTNSIGIDFLSITPPGPKLPGQTTQVIVQFENTGGSPCWVIDFTSFVHLPNGDNVLVTDGVSIAPGESLQCPSADARCEPGPYEYTVSTDDAVGECTGCPTTCADGDTFLNYYVQGVGDNLSGAGSTTDANACLGLPQALLTCDALVDKQVSCDGGATWVDPTLVLENEDETNGCIAADGAQILVQYQAQNTGTAALVDCSITDTNTLFSPGAVLVGDLAAGQTSALIPADLAPLCSDTLEGLEPDTATLTCECVDNTTEIFATAFDTATFECVSTELSTQASPVGNIEPGIDRTDTATLTGDAECQGGEVQFFLCDPTEVTGEGCPSGSGDAIGTPVSIASGTAVSDVTNPTAPGHYCWGAQWTGFGVCPAQYFTNNGDECFDIVSPPECAMYKSVSPETSKQGDTVTYHLGPICNTGQTTLVSGTCTDTINGQDFDCTTEMSACFPLDPGDCCVLDPPSDVDSSFADVDYTIMSTDEPGPVENTVTASNCTDDFGQVAPPCSASAEVSLVHPKFTVNKECTPDSQIIESGVPTTPINWTIVLENTGDTGLDIECTDPTAGIDHVHTVLASGQSATLNGVPYEVTEADCNESITNTVVCTATLSDETQLNNIVQPDSANSVITDTCSVSCPTGCRMTGGHVNMAGSVDAGFESDSGTKYTTGGQIGAPNESGCADSPWKGICDDGTCYGGLANGEPCETNTDCPNDSGHNSTRPWGDWEHNHHSGPDDGNITGGSFSFHSGTAAAPDEAFIQNIICEDPGWCVQARPAPNKQIFWEGTGVFHNLKGAKNTDLPLPDFGECPVQVWDKKTGGTLHYYRAHVVDSGEPAGQRQKPAVTDDCLAEEACLGNWAIAGCNQVTADCDIPAEDNPDKTALHPLCLAQNCTDCPDWYDIEIHCTADPESPVIYRVGHFILEGNFQLHPPVGDSCNFSCNGVCEEGQLDFIETCNPDCGYGDCCDADGMTIVQ